MLRDIYSDNGFLTETNGGHKLYHDIIERYVDEDTTINGGRMTIGSGSFVSLTIWLIMYFTAVM